MKNQVETIIDGSLDTSVIAKAMNTYISDLAVIAFPPELDQSIGISGLRGALEPQFRAHSGVVAEYTTNIIHEINERATILRGASYIQLQEKDKSLWAGKNGESVLFGVLVCVDKGVPGEAMGIDISNVGRVLAGDIEFCFIPSKHAFVPVSNALIKRFIHYGRQGKHTLVEPLVEHTSCGRRGQMLANEEAHRDIPSLQFIFEHIDILFPKTHPLEIEPIRRLWFTEWKRRGSAVITPDKGVYAGIIQKIAQRQALSQLTHDIQIISPIELYEKETGNVYAGLDSLRILTHPDVVSAGGFTRDVLYALATSNEIFSLQSFADAICSEVAKHCTVSYGVRKYKDLQETWLPTATDLVSVTETLWSLYRNNQKDVSSCVFRYFNAVFARAPELQSTTDNRLIHHLFHIIAYAYVLGTFTHGHEPGIHHIEQYLATGDHEIGAKPMQALGQGDLSRPSASEIFTGYSVLLHSKPGHDGTPIPVVIKLDTDRPGGKPMSTEETNVAFDDLHEFLKLWPYFLVGDMIPILMVRGKHTGGVSRLGLSVVKSLGDMVTLLERSAEYLPRFVPATNSLGEVVLVPAKNVLMEGVNAQGDLRDFRSRMVVLADRFTDSAVQSRFAH